MYVLEGGQGSWNLKNEKVGALDKNGLWGRMESIPGRKKQHMQRPCGEQEHDVKGNEKRSMWLRQRGTGC